MEYGLMGIFKPLSYQQILWKISIWQDASNLDFLLKKSST